MNIRKRETIFRGMVFDIEQMEVEIGRKGWHPFQIIRHPGGAAVLPVHEDGTVSLIRQHRPAVDALLWEIPAGRLDPQEAPDECARRELREETGFSARELVPLGMIHSSPGVFDEVIHLFAAVGIDQGEAEPEADEDIEVVRIGFEDACAMICDGRISDAKTIVAISRWQLLPRGGSGKGGAP